MSARVSSENQEWSFSRKAITVFTICYAFLYMFPRPFNEIPGVDVVFSVYTKPLEIVVLWFGKTVLGLTTLEKIAVTGSGDTTFDYVNLLFVFLISIVLTIVILLVSKKKNFQSWFHVTWVYARYYVGLFLILYGIIKFFNGQFQPTHITRLEQTYGESSPMGLLWTFMGHSKAYTFFGGFIEFVAGVLLLFRRTTIVGALMAFGVMLNVAAMNYCYDVPVKLFSSHLVLLSIFIVSPYLGSLYRFFFKQESLQLKIEPLVFKDKWQRVTHKISKIGLLVLCSLAIVMMIIQVNAIPENVVYAESFNGSYEVKMFVKNGDTIPPLETDTLRWNKVLMEDGNIVIKKVKGRGHYYAVKTDTITNQFTVTSYKDSTKIFNLGYKRLSKTELLVKGRWESDTLELLWQQRKKEDYELNKRGFHWINEYPFNR
ncbi:DoxX family protein [Flavobacterium sp.]|uniref:DoxX family protein n=1 Tax=Flavobacterium sp. TaxID=239 RepID=UPI00391BA0AD